MLTHKSKSQAAPLCFGLLKNFLGSEAQQLWPRFSQMLPTAVHQLRSRLTLAYLDRLKEQEPRSPAHACPSACAVCSHKPEATVTVSLVSAWMFLSLQFRRMEGGGSLKHFKVLASLCTEVTFWGFKGVPSKMLTNPLKSGASNMHTPISLRVFQCSEVFKCAVTQAIFQRAPICVPVFVDGSSLQPFHPFGRTVQSTASITANVSQGMSSRDRNAVKPRHFQQVLY